MYALFLTLLAVSIDCSIVIQLGIDMDIKYTNTEYQIQYEKDCCLGYGVICENERVVELHWDFTSNYAGARYPILHFPPMLRVLNLRYSQKSMIIQELPDTLKVMDLYGAYDIQLNLKVFPNLRFLGLFRFSTSFMPKLPKIPESVEYLDLVNYYSYEIFPSKNSNLKVFYGYDESYEMPFPDLPDGLEVVEIIGSKLKGPISFKFPHITDLYLTNSLLNGNLTILSPNITSLYIYDSSFDNLYLPYPEKVQSCALSSVFDTESNLTLSKLPCTYTLKSPRSVDCDSIILFARQLNMHLTNPEYCNYLSTSSNCCDDQFYHVQCKNNRIYDIYFERMNLNGTLNTTLLPDTLEFIYLHDNHLQGEFPNLTHFTNLHTIYMDNNQFSGPIMNKLPVQLKVLYANYNQLNGTIPNLNLLQDLFLRGNQFENVENQLIGNSIHNIDISYNQIKGIFDMSNYQGSTSFNFQSNFIDFIITTSKISSYYCDVTMNQLNQSALTNFINCNYQIQRYTPNQCMNYMKLAQKMDILNLDRDQNCCASNPYIKCDYNIMTELTIAYHHHINSFHGYAFSIQDLPLSLKKLLILQPFNQSTMIPPLIPGHIKYLEFTNANISGYLPQFAEGLETLKLTNLKLMGGLPLLPSTLKILDVTYCELSGGIPPLPPNLQALYLNGNQLSGPLPVFPDSLSIVVLGDKVNEGNTFTGTLNLYKPSLIILGNINISNVQINDTSKLVNCDLSFNPLSNSTLLSNYTICTQFYLTAKPLLMQIESTKSKTSSWFSTDTTNLPQSSESTSTVSTIVAQSSEISTMEDPEMLQSSNL
eukprot:NODE_654_length_4980_cov_0.656833.p1 type:complete len:818 gc:universal NODE_654_length_4980_cov_0.656833:2036-4489(+)